MAALRLDFYFEWRGGCLWPADETALRRFGSGPLEIGVCTQEGQRLAGPKLALPAELLRRIEAMTLEHDSALNWDYPPDPGPWRQADCDAFNRSVDALVADLRAALAPEVEIVDKQIRYVEDPDLDRYLADPQRFQRR